LFKDLREKRHVQPLRRAFSETIGKRSRRNYTKELATEP
jgi:hypothetical protein